MIKPRSKFATMPIRPRMLRDDSPPASFTLWRSCRCAFRYDSIHRGLQMV